MWAGKERRERERWVCGGKLESWRESGGKLKGEWREVRGRVEGS